MGKRCSIGTYCKQRHNRHGSISSYPQGKGRCAESGRSAASWQYISTYIQDINNVPATPSSIELLRKWLKELHLKDSNALQPSFHGYFYKLRRGVFLGVGKYVFGVYSYRYGFPKVRVMRECYP